MGDFYSTLGVSKNADAKEIKSAYRKVAMKILLIDNYDSFTYNLYHYLSILKCNVEVYRNNKITIDQIKKKKFDKIVISPGPGYPKNSGYCPKIVKYFSPKIPILGVCLGHQIIDS